MRISSIILTLSIAAIVITLAGLNLASAQVQTGSILCKIVDSDGKAPLSAVDVTTSGQGLNQHQISDYQGEAGFYGLPPGTYKIVAALYGYGMNTISNIKVEAGNTTNVEVGMSLQVETFVEETTTTIY